MKEEEKKEVYKMKHDVVAEGRREGGKEKEEVVNLMKNAEVAEGRRRRSRRKRRHIISGENSWL